MDERRKSLAIRVGGKAGQGVKSVGKLIQKYLQELGFYTFGYLGYPSLIRGGYNFYQIDFSLHPLQASKKEAEIYIPLSPDALEKAAPFLTPQTTILLDPKLSPPPSSQQPLINLNLSPLLKENNIPPIMINTALVGSLAKVLNYPLNPLEATIKKVYKEKPALVIKDNLKAAELGYSLDLQWRGKAILPPPEEKADLLTLSGNEAIALGFIAGGGKFYTAYPMTPSTNILHYLTKVADKKKIIVRQASTEIEAIGSALGASYAGARSMVATSGGGVDLMSEFISLAGIAEVPLVLVDAQRTGPGTGLPTWQEQGDLNLARHAGHGEFPRLVIAPGDPEEAYLLTQEALNLAERYQMPVILLSDKHLSESVYSCRREFFLKNQIEIEKGKIVSQIKEKYFLYPRYDLKQTISPRPLPGTPNGLHTTNSDEHNEYGQSIESEPLREKMQAKRLKKLELLKNELPLPKIYGPRRAKTALIGWGSTKGSILEAQEYLQKEKNKALDFIHFTYLYPLDYQRLEKTLANYSNFILIENNSTGQLQKDLFQMGIRPNQLKVVLKDDGEPFFVDELVNKISKALESFL